MRLLVAIVVWLGAIAGAAGVATAVSNSIHPSVDATSITSAQPGSMFVGDNFAKTLAKMKSKLGAGIATEQVVIYPGYVNVQADRGSGAVWAVLYAGGRWSESDAGDANPIRGTFPLSRVDPAGPRAVVRELARQHVSLAQVRYMIAEPDSESKRLSWMTYTSASSQPYTFTPGAHGHAPAVTAPVQPSAPPSTGQTQVSKGLKLAACVQRAGTDLARIQKCQAKYGG